MDSTLDLLQRSFPLLLQGTLMTLKLLAASAVVGFTLGLGGGILTCNRLRLPMLSRLIEGIALLLRGVPFYVLLLIAYFVLPDLLGFSLSPFSASIAALGGSSAGYLTQIVRAGINSIPEAQWESAFALGYPTRSALRQIILPQMVRNVLPAFANECESLLKSTAIVSSIGLLEITRMGMNLVSREMEPVAIYLTVAIFYLAISTCINLAAKLLERRLSYAIRY